MMSIEVWLALGGVCGAALRVIVTTAQPTLSRKSMVDILIGGAVGLLYPLYPVIDFPATATTLQKAAIIALLAYFASDFLVNTVSRFLPKGGIPPPGDPNPPPTVPYR